MHVSSPLRDAPLTEKLSEPTAHALQKPSILKVALLNDSGAFTVVMVMSEVIGLSTLLNPSSAGPAVNIVPHVRGMIGDMSFDRRVYSSVLFPMSITENPMFSVLSMAISETRSPSDASTLLQSASFSKVVKLLQVSPLNTKTYPDQSPIFSGV